MYNLKGAATIAFIKSLQAINQLGIAWVLIWAYKSGAVTNIS